MKLALALGKTLKELLDPETGLNSAEIAEWIAFDRLSPFGAWRDDYRTGILAAQQHNMWNDGNKKDPIDYVPDFMPEPKPIVTGQEVETFFRAFFQAQSAFVNQEKKKGGG